MIDVAQRAGVSQATVSLVMNGVSNPRVSQATRVRVMEAAEELGYRKGPRHNVPEHRRPVIGLLIDEVMSTPFAMPFIEGARDEAARLRLRQEVRRLTLPSEMGERFQAMGFARDVEFEHAFLLGDLGWRL